MSLLLIALLAPLQDPFPLEVGDRWTYVAGGKDSLVLHAAERIRLGGREAVVLQVIGGPFFGSTSHHFMSVGENRLSSRFVDGRETEGDRRDLLRWPLRPGLTWSSRGGSGYYGIGITAKVEEREVVDVPAGRFNAWRIDVRVDALPGTGGHKKVWFAPGTGFVRMEIGSLRRLRQEKRFDPPLRYDLRRFERNAPEWETEPGGPDSEIEGRIDRALGKLASDRAADREDASEELATLAWKAYPTLRARLREQLDLEVAARIRDVVRRLPRLKLVVRATKPKMAGGGTIPIEYRLTNVSPLPIWILPSLDHSDTGKRWPKYGIEILDGDGTPQRYGNVRCGNFGVLTSDDFVLLEPGEEFDPFFVHHHDMLAGSPKAPGTYSFRFTYDSKGPLDKFAADPALHPLLERLQRGRYTSNAARVIVE